METNSCVYKGVWVKHVAILKSQRWSPVSHYKSHMTAAVIQQYYVIANSELGLHLPAGKSGHP